MVSVTKGEIQWMLGIMKKFRLICREYMEKKIIGVRFRNARSATKKYLRKCVNWLKSVSKKTKRNIKLKLHNAKVVIGMRISQVWYWVKNILKKCCCR